MSEPKYDNSPIAGCGCLIFIIVICMFIGSCIHESAKSIIKEAIKESRND